MATPSLACPPHDAAPWCSFPHGVPNNVYVATRAHWRRVARQLRARGNVSRVSLLAGSHFNLTDLAPRQFRKSCAYLAAVGQLFADANFTVRYRIGQPPDDDARFMSRVGVLAPSGGAFARMVAAAVKPLGVHVIRTEVPDGRWEARLEEETD